MARLLEGESQEGHSCIHWRSLGIWSLGKDHLWCGDRGQDNIANHTPV